MPVKVILSRIEAEAVAAAGIPGLENSLFTYDPANTMTLIEQITKAAAEGADRVCARLADLYGKNFIRRGGSPLPAPTEIAVEPAPVPRPTRRKVRKAKSEP